MAAGSSCSSTLPASSARRPRTAATRPVPPPGRSAPPAAAASTWSSSCQWPSAPRWPSPSSRCTSSSRSPPRSSRHAWTARTGTAGPLRNRALTCGTAAIPGSCAAGCLGERDLDRSDMPVAWSGAILARRRAGTAGDAEPGNIAVPGAAWHPASWGRRRGQRRRRGGFGAGRPSRLPGTAESAPGSGCCVPSKASWPSRSQRPRHPSVWLAGRPAAWRKRRNGADPRAACRGLATRAWLGSRSRSSSCWSSFPACT